MNNNFAIGTDIEENSRFEDKTSDFLERIFTDSELKYCFKHKKPAPHLCARFCAKEAVVKALYTIGISDIYYGDIEILNKGNGVPYVKILKYPDLNIKISLSHCKTYSTASAFVIKN